MMQEFNAGPSPSLFPSLEGMRSIKNKLCCELFHSGTIFYGKSKSLMTFDNWHMIDVWQKKD